MARSGMTLSRSRVIEIAVALSLTGAAAAYAAIAHATSRDLDGVGETSRAPKRSSVQNVENVGFADTVR